MIQLSRVQWHMLTFIQHYTEVHQVSPDPVEINQGVGVHSIHIVRRELRTLEALGLLSRPKNDIRIIVLHKQPIGFVP